MPFYPLKKISGIAENRQAYLRGVSGYNAGWVGDYTAAANAFYPEYITARAQEGEMAYHVEVGFDERDEAEYLECNCGRFHPQQGACKHIVAVLVHKYYRDMIEGLPTAAQLMTAPVHPATDPAAQQLIDRYMTGETLRLTAEDTAAQVVLTPILDLSLPRPAVAFTVGTQRPYRIKNLARFAECMRNGERAAYGKGLEFLHHPAAFAPACLPLLTFLLAELSERQAPLGATAPTGTAGRLSLSPAGFDRLFSLLKDRTVTLREGEIERPVRLMEGEPLLTVTAERETEGVRLWSEAVRPVTGTQSLYILHRGVLYRTSADYTRRMGDWVRVNSRAADGIFVAPAQLPDFCAGVLETLRPYIHLEGEEHLRAYAPLPLQAEIWLDAPAPDTVTARVVYRYGEQTVEPYGDTPYPAELHRDGLRELAVKLAVERLLPTRQEGSALPMLQGGDEALFAFVTDGVETLRRVATVYATDAFESLLPTAPPTVNLGVRLLDDLLEMELDMEQVRPEELAGILTGYRERRTYHRLRDGRFIRLDEDMLAGLAELADSLGLTPQELRSGRLSLPKYRALYLEQLLRRQPAVTRDEAFRNLTRRCEQAAAQEWPLPASLQSVLRGYQKEGYRWLRTMEEVGFGGILADDMGLGKTLQVIALFLAAKERGETTPSLVVCPTSVVLGWEREIARFAPALRVLCVIGDAAERRRRLDTVSSYDVI
ncbi:MAG: SNF2 helicase associated domain-containing protein, partial [Clostridia bacterium]|nr:SNF2 helicase associated domain-containing protein [Clostridia bacterium]